jgi:hypothetical protein
VGPTTKRQRRRNHPRAPRAGEAVVGRGAASRPKGERGGGAGHARPRARLGRGHDAELGRARGRGGWAARGKETPAQEREGEEKGKRVFPFLIYFLDAYVTNSLNKQNRCMAGMVQQPKDLTLAFYLHKMSS